ncbi:hypothetical protein BCR33DRAFT_434697 [Rhizoclosmatium globosum]|uniref:G-protein coupled receptors family 3 profile domain-containing protein n=1 Tax=Rhizoclosmatium globosum TaxID=329046 RepID=A0A1Y2BU54_9FUNG|nr:hypothetical protein BCR33DRAFT_434697 [Rhizoclosmatium globosum]|eukprot:ORY38214.1 hypothetical protein BCR33DRAFT_434697 [Rhizoclosmatium globosum]
MPYTLISLLGSLTSLTSLLFFINDPSLHSVTYGSGFPPRIHSHDYTVNRKNFYVYKVCSASTSLNKQAVKRLKYATVSFYVVCFFVEVVILACWTVGGVKPVPRQVTFHEFTVMTCSPVKGSEAVAMYAFNSLILVALLSVAVMTRNISPEYSETSFLVLLAFGLLLVALLIIGLDADSHVVIKQAVCLWAASLLVPFSWSDPLCLKS